MLNICFFLYNFSLTVIFVVLFYFFWSYNLLWFGIYAPRHWSFYFLTFWNPVAGGFRCSIQTESLLTVLFMFVIHFYFYSNIFTLSKKCLLLTISLIIDIEQNTQLANTVSVLASMLSYYYILLTCFLLAFY